MSEALQTEFAKHVPGMFTAFGIIGTFVGIALGLGLALNDLNSKGADLSKATGTLLEHIGPAFYASLTAVSCAVIFLIFERIFVGSCRKRLFALQEKLDDLFPLRTTEDILRDILTQNEQQSRSLKDFSTDLAGAVKTSMELLIQSQMEQLQASNQNLADTLGRTVTENLAPVSENLKLAVEELKREQASSTENTLRSMVDHFSSSLTASAQGEFSQMAAAISQTSETLGSVKSELQSFVSTISNHTGQQAELMGKEVARLREEAAEAQKTSRKQLDGLLSSLTGTLGHLQQEMMTRSEQTLTSVGSRLTDMVQQSMTAQDNMQRLLAETLTSAVEQIRTSNASGAESIARVQESVVERLTNLLTDTQAKMSVLMEDMGKTLRDAVSLNLKSVAASISSISTELRNASSAVVKELGAATLANLEEMRAAMSREVGTNMESVRAGTVGAVTRLSDTLEETMTRIAEGLNDLINGARETNEQLGARFTQLAHLLESLSTDTDSRLSEIDERLTAGVTRVAGLIEDLDALGMTLKGNMTGLAESSGRLSTVAQSLSATSSNLNNAAEGARRANDQISAIILQLDAQTRSSSQTLISFNAAAAALEEVTGHFTEFDAVTQRFFQEVDQDLGRYYNTVSESLSKYLSKLDDSLDKAASAIRSTVEELGDKLEELNDTVGSLPQRLGR